MPAVLRFEGGKYRCEECGKVAYQSAEIAHAAALRISERQPMRPYLDERCGWWHVTRKDAHNWLVTQTRPIELRDYQGAAHDALYQYFHDNAGNPIVAMPTGTGKSIVIGEFIRSALWQWGDQRILCLTHVKELIDQNLKTLTRMWPSAPAGVYSAGIGRKEHGSNVTFAGIQSAYKQADLFGHIDLVIIDECHLVSLKGTTMYRFFIEALRKKNPKLKVIGFSATPYRLGQGMLTDADQGLFTDIAFDLTSRESFNWLIAQGWIAPLIPKRTDTQLDVSGVRIHAGEFVAKDLQEHVDKDSITRAALEEACSVAEHRKHWLVFASGIEHTEHVTEALNELYHIPATCVHSQMPAAIRDQRIADYKAGRYQAMVNNNILTTGFDYPEVDAIVMLRPTASPVLWVQMLGRGTRPVFPEGTDTSSVDNRLAAIKSGPKQNCLVLDFAGNTSRLGPINDPIIPRKKGRGARGMAPVRLCEFCGCYSHAACRFCENPECGKEFPQMVKLFAQASEQELIVGDRPPINKYPVQRVIYRLHQKEGKPTSMRVDYWCGMRRFSEFVLLDHSGYAARVARQWWNIRSPWGVPPSVADGMKAVNFLPTPKTISVIEKGKYPEIVGYEF